jgi:hypothetical protein
VFDPDALLRRLAAAGIDHIIVGGVAVGMHGAIRGTDDLDICPNPDPANLARLAQLLAELDVKQKDTGDFDPEELPYDRTRPEDLAQGGNFRLDTGLGGLDVMQWISGLGADRAFDVLSAEAISVEWQGLTVKVCSLPHLVAMKQSAGRPRDLQDLADLEIANS